MRTQKITGWLLIAGAAGVLVPYTLLTILFVYPDILRKDTGEILTRFHAGGAGLIFAWFAFAILGLPLIPAYSLIGRQGGKRSALLSVATTIGIAGLIVQMIGLLRWTFVVPVLADQYVHATDDTSRAMAVTGFKIIHQFAGVLLGEYIGQLFTIIWTILVSMALVKMKWLPKWMGVLGVFSSVIYSLAQAELFATVIPGFPVWDMAGFIGSTLWLIWLILLGIFLIRRKNTQPDLA
ncbi:MAG: DUF4386 domain-containing protein [Bacteroidetes bacterium]|nr:DUF4386 domain-containing protein [Bacteroidota bacterium]